MKQAGTIIDEIIAKCKFHSNLENVLIRCY